MATKVTAEAAGTRENGINTITMYNFNRIYGYKIPTNLENTMDMFTIVIHSDCIPGLTF